MRHAPQRDFLWQFIVREVRSSGRFPAQHRLKAEMGVSEGRIRQLVRDLERQGLIIRRSFGPGRSPEFAFTPQGLASAGTGIPLVGAIRGGPLGTAVFEPMGFLELPNKAGRFALRVVGDSMADEILDGDCVLLEPNPDLPNGKVCAVRVSGSDATLKRFYRLGNRARLEANNPVFDSITVALEDVRIDGVMVGLFRGDVVNLAPI